MSPLKVNSLGRGSIEIRRSDSVVTISRDLNAHVFHMDEQQVRLFRAMCIRCEKD